MNTPILILDTNYLCYRAFHALSDLHGEDGFGAIFGVLRDIVLLQESFATSRMVFAFDGKGPSIRQTLLPTYKSTRRTRHENENDEDTYARRNFLLQVDELCTTYLPDIGFRNVFRVDGFEADDVIASITKALPRKDEAIIISSDQDLWQLIKPNVWCYNPQTKKSTTDKSFRDMWNIAPRTWAKVKALAGCSTDDIQGIPGVGEITAARWYRKTLGEHTKAYQKISDGHDVYTRNIGLVELPLDGTPNFILQDDEVTETVWCRMVKHLGMPSLAKNPPRVAIRSRGRRHGKKEKSTRSRRS